MAAVTFDEITLSATREHPQLTLPRSAIDRITPGGVVFLAMTAAEIIADQLKTPTGEGL